MISKKMIILMLVQFVCGKYVQMRQQEQKDCYNECFMVDCYFSENDDKTFMRCIKMNDKCLFRESQCSKKECFDECNTPQTQTYGFCQKCLNICSQAKIDCTPPTFWSDYGAVIIIIIICIILACLFPKAAFYCLISICQVLGQ